MTDSAFRFTRALVRRPADASVDGLRAVDVGAPDVDAFRAHHADYVLALERAGVTVTVLPAAEAFPDSVFVEDAALCLPECAVLLRPGAPSRRGEVALLRPVLEALYRRVLVLDGPGSVEGGDVLATGREILVGLSARTDAAGVERLAALLSPFGHVVRSVRTPPDVLHFKTDCSLLGAGIVLATERLAAGGLFDDYRVVPVAPGEQACANAIRVNDRVLFPAGFPVTARRLRDAGFALSEIDNSEAARLDGGMSCLSLRFSIDPHARAATLPGAHEDSNTSDTGAGGPR